MVNNFNNILVRLLLKTHLYIHFVCNLCLADGSIAANTTEYFPCQTLPHIKGLSTCVKSYLNSGSVIELNVNISHRREYTQ